MPLQVKLQLVDLDDGCGPVRDAVVELWHTDARGVYSGFDTDDGNTADEVGTTFLRGYQRTDAAGRVEFQTIYPGWYPSRATHMHVRVIAGGDQLTTQLYFEQARTDVVYTDPPYRSRGPPPDTNVADSLGATIPSLTVDPSQPGDALLASHILGLAR